MSVFPALHCVFSLSSYFASTDGNRAFTAWAARLPAGRYTSDESGMPERIDGPSRTMKKRFVAWSSARASLAVLPVSVEVAPA